MQSISPATFSEQVPPFLQKSTVDAHEESDMEQFLPERWIKVSIESYKAAHNPEKINHITNKMTHLTQMRVM